MHVLGSFMITYIQKRQSKNSVFLSVSICRCSVLCMKRLSACSMLFYNATALRFADSFRYPVTFNVFY